ncbi:MAG: serine/threonine-protein kinase [Gemmatimonadota bacterium]
MADILERLKQSIGDRYQIDGEIGRGGMATVFLANDVKHGRGVAIKVLHPELAASLGAERFNREIMVAARLQHPHILSLYDSGEADGLLYYVMPFVVGESLRDRIKRDHLLPIEDALEIAIEVADALGYAHSMGVIHRDIKPENILLSGGHALVADFGIARAVSAAGSEKLTETGMAVGTPLYMSPEQSTADEVGPTSDIYSLGCVLYEMLAGQPPFTGITPRSIMARHAMEQVPSLQVVRDTVPDEVEDAIFCALNKTPADRPQTASQFAEMLGVPAGTTSTRRTATRMTAQRRAASRMLPVIADKPWYARRWTWGAAAVLVLAGGLAAWRLSSHRVPALAGNSGLDPHHIAVAYFEDLSPKKDLGYLADGLTEGLIGTLGEVQGLTVISKGGVQPYRVGNIPADSMARALGAGILVKGTVEPEGDRVRVNVRLVDGPSGVDLDRASFEQPSGKLLVLRDSLTGQVADLIRKRLGEELRIREQRQSTTNVAAWSLLQQAEQRRKSAEDRLAAGDTVGMTRAYDVADSLLALAEPLDPQWPDPSVLRAAIAYLRSRNSADPALTGKLIDSGLVHVEHALAIDAKDADALEQRGDLRYWRWLLNLEPDRAEAAKLLSDAQADLEAATRINPAQAGAWATLSHMYNQTGTGVDVNMAASRALEADAYLSNADVVLNRLFLSSYDLGDYTKSKNWCQQGQHRFPAEHEFVECQLWLLTMKTGDAPDPALAWRLADSILHLTPEPQRAFQKLNDQLAVAAVLARVGKLDSASHLAARSLGDAEVDPTRDLANIAAFVYALCGDKTRAIEQLKIYLAANPQRRENFAKDPGWWFRSLEEDARYQRLVNVRS